MKIETIRIHWSDVKAQLLACLRDGKRWEQAKGADLRVMRQAGESFDTSFYGGTAGQTIQWLQEGFYAPELQASADRVPMAAMTRAGWSEEPSGDIELGRLYGGYDDYYFEVAERDMKPGLRIEVDMFFAAAVGTDTVREYGAWVAGLIGALETAGYDLEVDLVCPVRKLYKRAGDSARQDVQVTVKQTGELSDFTEWSACLSPIGTRVVMFAAFGVACDQIGKRQTDHMAMSLASHERRFGVAYDTDANTLRITADQRWSGDFPTDLMNDALVASGLL